MIGCSYSALSPVPAMSLSVSHPDSDGKPRRVAEFLGRVLDSTMRRVQFRRSREEPHSLADLMKTSKVDGNPAESMFLYRLPVEVRLLICDYVFADQKTFLFVHGACTSLRDAVAPGSDINFDSLQWTSYPFANGVGMALLQTCRQIYAEGLITAVNSSVFYLRGPVAFSLLDNRALRTVRPERLSLINHLDLQWDFRVKGYEPNQHSCPETDFATWQRIWDVVAVNMRLKSLELRLAFTGPKDQMSVDAPWLMPLRQVRSIKSLKIDIRDSREPRLMLYTLNCEMWNMMMAKKQPLPLQTRLTNVP